MIEIEQKRKEIGNGFIQLDKTNILVPDYYAPSIEEIDFSILAKLGIRYGIFDADNTLVSAGENELSREYLTLLKNIVSNGVFEKICIASNSRRKPLTQLAESIGAINVVPGIFIRKPSSRYFRRVLDELGCDPHQAVMIGDTLTTDISGAKKTGILSILVDRLGSPSIPNNVHGMIRGEPLHRSRFQTTISMESSHKKTP